MRVKRKEPEYEAFYYDGGPGSAAELVAEVERLGGYAAHLTYDTFSVVHVDLDHIAADVYDGQYVVFEPDGRWSAFPEDEFAKLFDIEVDDEDVG